MSRKFDVTKLIEGEFGQVPKDGGYKNVRFEGFLCSASPDPLCDAKKVYFTIDGTGKALHSFERHFMGFDKRSNLSFTVENKNTQHSLDTWTLCDDESDSKPDVVEIVRYFRRWDKTLDEVSSFGGVTVVCELNYNTMTMKVYPAFCSDSDNFDKQCGLAIAENRQELGQGIMMKFTRDMSIRDNLCEALTFSEWDYISNDTEFNNRMFIAIHRCLFDSEDGNLLSIF